MSARQSLLLIIGAGLLGGVAPGQDAPPHTQPRNPGEWIRLLGSDSYRDREEATRRLMEINEASLALEQARRSGDAEVRARARLILGVIRDRVQAQAADELLQQVQAGQVEELITSLAGANGAEADKTWSEVVRVVGVLATRAARIRGAEFHVMGKDPRGRELARSCPPEGGWQKRFVVSGLGHEVSSLGHCLLVSSGPVKHINRINCSVLLVHGDISSITSLRTSLVVCRGNIGDITSVDDSIVLATGRIGKVVCAEESLFQASKLAEFISSRNNIFLNSKVAVATPAVDDRFLEARPARPK